MGSIVGVALVLPFLARRYSKTNGSLTGASPYLMKALGQSALWGAGLSTILGAARVAQLHSSLTDDEFSYGMQDRAYRLHYNQGQNRCDLLSEVGMAVGGTAALIFVSPAAAVVLGGAAAGAACGVLAHVATYNATADADVTVPKES